MTRGILLADRVNVSIRKCSTTEIEASEGVPERVPMHWQEQTERHQESLLGNVQLYNLLKVWLNSYRYLVVLWKSCFPFLSLNHWRLLRRSNCGTRSPLIMVTQCLNMWAVEQWSRQQLRRGRLVDVVTADAAQRLLRRRASLCPGDYHFRLLLSLWFIAISPLLLSEPIDLCVSQSVVHPNNQSHCGHLRWYPGHSHFEKLSNYWQRKPNPLTKRTHKKMRF